MVTNSDADVGFGVGVNFKRCTVSNSPCYPEACFIRDIQFPWHVRT